MSTLNHSQDHLATIGSIVERHKTVEGPLLPILHAIQKALGYIPDVAIELLAKALKSSTAEIHGVISFYHFFRTHPAGKHVVQICRAESCQAVGGRDLEQSIMQRLNINYHQTTPDGEFTLEPVYCLGNCACSPAIRVNDDIYGRVTLAKVDAIISELQTVVVEVKS